MLAQSFKTAKELGLNDKQLEGLIKTLKVLETDKVKHQSIKDYQTTSRPKFDGLFNMAIWAGKENNCGTVCCIGGTAESLMGERLFSLVSLKDKNPKLCDLFCPSTRINWNDITPSQAATALRSYLTTGKANWGKV